MQRDHESDRSQRDHESDRSQRDHLADDQLIDALYGLGDPDEHLQTCMECRLRLSAMEGRRDARVSDDVSSAFLNAQRRQIYTKLAQSGGWWSRSSARRWAAAAAATVILSGGALYYQEQHRRSEDLLSDAQLAQDVSAMSASSEASPTAPLQALFEE